MSTDAKIIDQTDKYLMVKVHCEFGLKLTDIELIEVQFGGDYVASEYIPTTNDIQVMLRKHPDQST